MKTRSTLLRRFFERNLYTASWVATDLTLVALTAARPTHLAVVWGVLFR